MNTSNHETLFAAIIEGSPFAKILVNSDGRIALVNAQTEALFDYSREELLGRSVEMLVPERFRHAHLGMRESFFAAPSARIMGSGRDLYGLRKDGTEVPIEIGLNPIVTAGQMFTLAAITDITERKRIEASRLVDARKANAFATISHELRTPLSAIIGTAEMLAREPLSERGRRDLEAISDSAEALLFIIGEWRKRIRQEGGLG